MGAVVKAVAAPVAAVAKAAAAPVTSTVAAVQSVAKGDLGGAAQAAIGGAKDTIAPVVAVGKASTVDLARNAGGGIVGAAKGVVAGDWGAAGRGLARFGTSYGYITQAEGSIANLNDGTVVSPTGYGAIAYDQGADGDAYKRAAITTAVLIGGAYAAGAGSGIGGAAGAASAGSTGASVGTGGLSFAEIAQGAGIAGAAAKSLTSSGNRSPSGIPTPDIAGDGGTNSIPPAVLAVGAVALFLLIRRLK